MGTRVEGVQPAVLRWARETQGYAVDEVALRLNRPRAEIEAWESGESAPTYAQLERIAYELYKRPLAVFFLPEPPSEPRPKEQFRTLPDIEIKQLLANTRYQLRLAVAYRYSLIDLCDGVNPAKHCITKNMRVSVHDNVQRVASSIREYLGVSMQQQVAWRSTDEALKTWRRCVEDAGVFVFKDAFKQEGISGFCLSDVEFPIIYLNNSSAKTRQIFTLFHELAHLLLNVNTITKCDLSYIDFLPQKDKRLERFCNALAAEILVPAADFSKQHELISSISEKSVEELADRYQVSRESILRRMLDLGRVSPDYYNEKSRKWNDIRIKSGSGGNYYLTRATYLGESFLQLVFGKVYQGRLSHEQAAEHLGVKVKSLPGLEEIMLSRQATA